jgi:hypothetical protein
MDVVIETMTQKITAIKLNHCFVAMLPSLQKQNVGDHAVAAKKL